MSRSRKRTPIVKDKKPHNNSYNKSFRKTNKMRVLKGLEPLHMYTLVDPWDVCDWKCYCPEDPLIYRK